MEYVLAAITAIMEGADPESIDITIASNSHTNMLNTGVLYGAIFMVRDDKPELANRLRVLQKRIEDMEAAMT